MPDQHVSEADCRWIAVVRDWAWMAGENPPAWAESAAAAAKFWTEQAAQVEEARAEAARAEAEQAAAPDPWASAEAAEFDQYVRMEADAKRQETAEQAVAEVRAQSER